MREIIKSGVERWIVASCRAGRLTACSAAGQQLAVVDVDEQRKSVDVKKVQYVYVRCI